MKRNVSQVVSTCSFVLNSGFGIGCGMGVTGLITTSLCLGRGLSGIFVHLPSNKDYSIHNRFSCVNPYNYSCSNCHSLQLIFGMGNLIIFNSIILKNIYQCCKQYILRGRVVFSIDLEDIGLLIASGLGIYALGISSLDLTDCTVEEEKIMVSMMVASMYFSITMYFILGSLRLEQHYEE